MNIFLEDDLSYFLFFNLSYLSKKIFSWNWLIELLCSWFFKKFLTLVCDVQSSWSTICSQVEKCKKESTSFSETDFQGSIAVDIWSAIFGKGQLLFLNSDRCYWVLRYLCLCLLYMHPEFIQYQLFILYVLFSWTTLACILFGSKLIIYNRVASWLRMYLNIHMVSLKYLSITIT